MSPLHLISSMASKSLLKALADQFTQQTSLPVNCEAIGGVDVAKRVKSGEVADVVVLARASIDEFAQAALVSAEVCDIAQSGIGVAIQSGAPLPDISSEAGLKEAVENAPSVSFSTGPSGVYLEKRFAAWGILDKVRSRIVVPPPGTGVGSFVASGKAAIGFQQLSELVEVSGITIVGPLPGSLQLLTVFSGAVLSTSTQPEAAIKLLKFLAAPDHDGLRKTFGMERPAPHR
jgi:molybdate transport system substrate-binding protein